MADSSESAQAARSVVPRTGMLATVRNRRGMMTAVEPCNAGPEGRLHLTTIEYLNADGQAQDDHLIWEREPGARLLEPNSPPSVLDRGPIIPTEFDALVRAARWSALTPFVKEGGTFEISKTAEGCVLSHEVWGELHAGPVRID